LKSKTPQGSRKFSKKTAQKEESSSGLSVADAQVFSVGHEPVAQLAPQDSMLFRAFQSNLLSLISHELRTPLIGVINALSVLDEEELPPGVSSAELVRMARRNAQRLHQSLNELLELAELQSGTFHARLKEVDLPRFVRSRLDAQEWRFKETPIRLTREITSAEIPVLGDPQKLGRALELCLNVVLEKGVKVPGSKGPAELKIRISFSTLELAFELSPEAVQEWDAAWSQGLVAFQGGVASPASVFGGILRSEQEFLTRSEEGLGSGFTLIHEIMRLHQGSFSAERSGAQVRLLLHLVPLDSEQSLRAVLVSRTSGVAQGLNMVTLVLIEVPVEFGAQASSGSEWVHQFRAKVKAHLFRSADAVYALPSQGRVAMILDDTKREDTHLVIRRIEKALGFSLKTGFAHCPSDCLDPSELMDLANSRIENAHTQSVQ
jgi:hypothetical protein